MLLADAAGCSNRIVWVLHGNLGGSRMGQGMDAWHPPGCLPVSAALRKGHGGSMEIAWRCWRRSATRARQPADFDHEPGSVSIGPRSSAILRTLSPPPFKPPRMHGTLMAVQNRRWLGSLVISVALLAAGCAREKAATKDLGAEIDDVAAMLVQQPLLHWTSQCLHLPGRSISR